jgi:PiT family inorganic phosphate transporter
VALAWLVTMPFAALVAAAAYVLSTLPSRALSLGVMTVILVVLVGLLVVAIRRAPKATDVAQDAGMEREMPLRAGTGSIIDTGRVPASREVTEAERRTAERERAEPL